MNINPEIKRKTARGVSILRLFDRYFFITVRNYKYDHRKMQAMIKEIDTDTKKVTYSPKLDENGEPIFEQIYEDLPGTLKDEEEFQ